MHSALMNFDFQAITIFQCSEIRIFVIREELNLKIAIHTILIWEKNEKNSLHYWLCSGVFCLYVQYFETFIS